MEEAKLSDYHEWARLILRARSLGISKEEVREYLHSKAIKKSTISKECSP